MPGQPGGKKFPIGEMDLKGKTELKKKQQKGGGERIVIGQGNLSIQGRGGRGRKGRKQIGGQGSGQNEPKISLKWEKEVQARQIKREKGVAGATKCLVKWDMVGKVGGLSMAKLARSSSTLGWKVSKVPVTKRGGTI